jgi:hypothetical protein
VDKTTRYELKTPFGDVYVGSGKYGNGRIISVEKDNETALSYDKICERLDKYFCQKKYAGYAENDNDLEKAKEGIIDPIINYLKQELNDKQQIEIKNANGDVSKILSKIKPFTSSYKFKDNEVNGITDKQAASVLCGILMLSESHEFRNPTGGKFERKAMKNVLKLAKDRCANPFSVVFDRTTGRYLPAHSKEATKEEYGGQTQTKATLSKKVLMSQAMKRKFDKKVSQSHISNWISNYAEKSNIYLKTLEPTLDFKLSSNNKIINKKTKDKIKPKNIEEAEKIEQALGYLSNIKKNCSDFYLELDKIPDIPKDSDVVKLKKELLKQKHVGRINKLMNCSTKINY